MRCKKNVWTWIVSLLITGNTFKSYNCFADMYSILPQRVPQQITYWTCGKPGIERNQLWPILWTFSVSWGEWMLPQWWRKMWERGYDPENWGTAGLSLWYQKSQQSPRVYSKVFGQLIMEMDLSSDSRLALFFVVLAACWLQMVKNSQFRKWKKLDPN